MEMKYEAGRTKFLVNFRFFVSLLHFYKRSCKQFLQSDIKSQRIYLVLADQICLRKLYGSWPLMLSAILEEKCKQKDNSSGIEEELIGLFIPC